MSFAAWNYYKIITIDSTKVSADLTDFPVYVDLSNLGTDFFSNVKSDGSDIRVTKSDGTTEVPIEVVAIDTGAETGELHFKADGTLSSSSNTDFYIYYGNSGASAYAEDATYGRENVWNSGYVAVYHLQEAVNTTAGGYLDTTANDNDGTGVSMALTAPAAKLGKGQDFDGSGDYIEMSNSGSLAFSGNLTLSGWLNIDVSGYGTVLSKYTANGWIWYAGSGILKQRFYIEGSWVGSNNFISSSTWEYCTVTRSGSTVTFYRNGSSDGGGTLSSSIVDGGVCRMGASHTGGEKFNGQMDEMRISNVARSSSWISTEYNNQNSPATFYSVGTQQSNGSSEQPAIFFGAAF